MPHILVVDDEPHITDVVSAYLVREGHQVETADRRRRGLRAGTRDPAGPDRARRGCCPVAPASTCCGTCAPSGVDSAVILLTARDDLIDRVAGLEMGADDYVTKPFEPRELMARVGAVLRRVGERHADDRARTFLDLEHRHRRARGPPRRRGHHPDARRVRPAGDAHRATRRRPRSRASWASASTARPSRPTIAPWTATSRTCAASSGRPPAGGDYIETVRGVGYRAARR